jgi:hypothetical protein
MELNLQAAVRRLILRDDRVLAPSTTTRTGGEQRRRRRLCLSVWVCVCVYVCVCVWQHLPHQEPRAFTLAL